MGRPQWQPPWGNELRVKLRNAANYGQNEVGSDIPNTAREVFAKLATDKVAQTTTTLLHPIDFAQLAARPVGPIAELVPGWIEWGIATMLSGRGGSNKSRLALQIGLCLQAGVKVFGQPTQQCSFLYLDYENGQDEVARRIQKMGYGLKLNTMEGARYFDFKTLKHSDGLVPAYAEAPALARIDDTGVTLGDRTKSCTTRCAQSQATSL